MNPFNAILAARAHATGRAQRSGIFRHRAIAKNPLCIVAFQLGAEPYTVGAIALGTKASGPKVYVPGYPINRELLFTQLLKFAQSFCPAFEAHLKGPCDSISYFGHPLDVPRQLPQVVVANNETVELLGRLGRRLAYLKPDGDFPADPLLPRLGRHFMFLAEHACLPGQQIILSATDLLASHYVAAISSMEAGSLAAMDAWIDPPKGIHGFKLAEVAERQAVGPTPSPTDGQEIYALMQTFRDQCQGSTDPKVVAKHVQPLSKMYGSMVQGTWDLVWRVVSREQAFPEAPSVARRAQEDRIAYASHMAWMNGPVGGLRRTRQTPRSAALHLDKLERAQAMLVAEEAIDDPLRMAPHVLEGKAFAGRIVDRELTRREFIGQRWCLRPSMTVRTDEPCLMPVGTWLWWTELPAGREWLVYSIAPAGGGSDVVVVLQTNRQPEIELPLKGARVSFSQFNTRPGYELYLPSKAPWTHRTPEPAPENLDFDGPQAEAA